MNSKHRSIRGFSLVEMLISIAVGTVILASALSILRSAMDVSSLVAQRGEMQQNSRVAINLIATDLRQAGSRMPTGGIALPTTETPFRACDSSGCHIDNPGLADFRLYAVTPGDGLGKTINGQATDVVTLAYRDPSLNLDEFPLVDIAADGTEIEVDAATNPSITDSVVGLVDGDVVVVTNIYGSAAAVVTGVAGNKISFADGDPINFNQSGAATGNIANLANPGTGGFPLTTAFRVSVVTFYIDDEDLNNPRLMRQIGARAPVAVAEHITSLQFTYDIFDEATTSASAELAGAGGLPNQIRKVNIEVTGRSPGKSLFGRDMNYVTLRTSVSGRNLAFRDRYPDADES